MSANNDALDDLAMMRAAGSGPVLEDTEHLYPPRKWEHEYTWDKERPNVTTIRQFPHAAQPGHMPTLADIINERNHWRTGYEIAIQKAAELQIERDMLAGWLSAMIMDISGGDTCPHCYAEVDDGGGVIYIWSAAEFHAADCPWRLAAEYVQKMEVPQCLNGSTPPGTR
jgi:hypothetical protein